MADAPVLPSKPDPLQYTLYWLSVWVSLVEVSTDSLLLLMTVSVLGPVVKNK